MIQRTALSEEDIYAVLSNSRRRGVFRELTSVGSDMVSLRELSVRLATAESGQSPPPAKLRESVYSSLHQTHLPLLEELGVVVYDRDSRAVGLCECAREVDRYMERRPFRAFSWGELYRTLGIVSLLVVLAAMLEMPAVSAVDPLLWTSGFLAAFAAAVGYQFWTNRWYVLQALRS